MRLRTRAYPVILLRNKSLENAVNLVSMRKLLAQRAPSSNALPAITRSVARSSLPVALETLTAPKAMPTSQ